MHRCAAAALQLLSLEAPGVVLCLKHGFCGPTDRKSCFLVERPYLSLQPQRVPWDAEMLRASFFPCNAPLPHVSQRM